MFTGIIDHCGVITELNERHQSITAAIRCQFDNLQAGESIAVDGVCLTVVDPGEHLFHCDISPETYRLTTARDFKPGTEVNLERALRLSDRLGGHFVTGHVDTIARVQARRAEQEFTVLTIADLPAEALPYLIRKGSIAINGVSLTINRVLPQGLEVMLIPHTLERTNLKHLQSESRVNIEYDWMARVVIRQFELQQDKA